MIIKIAFDPTESKEPLTKEVFEDKISRTLWLLWRRNHIVCQNFNKEVLEQAKLIKRFRPSSDLDLFDRLRHLSNFTRGDLFNFCRDDVCQYFYGNKTVEYEIVKQDLK